MIRSARGVAPTAIVLVAIVALVTACTSEDAEPDPSGTAAATGSSSPTTSEGAVADDATDAPDGFTIVSHPEARVAMPDDWTEGDPGDLVEADPDIVDRRIPAPDDQPFGARLNHYDRTEERTFDSAEEPALLQAGLLPPEQEQTRREEVEVAGAAEGFLLQVEADSTLVDQPVRFTYVVGLREDGAAFLLSIVGTAEQVPDDVVSTMVDTFALTEPADSGEAAGS